MAVPRVSKKNESLRIRSSFILLVFLGIVLLSASSSWNSLAATDPIVSSTNTLLSVLQAQEQQEEEKDSTDSRRLDKYHIGISLDSSHASSDEDLRKRPLHLLTVYDEANPQICKTNFGDLTWTHESTYDDLWKSCLANGSVVSLSDLTGSHKMATLMHQVPKTGSTSVRYQTFQLLRSCGPHEQAKERRPGYYQCPYIAELTSSCPHIESYAFDSYPKLKNDTRPCFDYANRSKRHFLHTIAFREFLPWAKSSMNQIIKQKEKRKRFPNYLATCQFLQNQWQPPDHCPGGSWELDFEKYTKQVLRLVLRESSSSHPVLLHDYKNVTYLQTNFRSKMGLAPLNMTEMKNTERSDLTCPDTVLEAFFACFAHRV